MLLQSFYFYAFLQTVAQAFELRKVVISTCEIMANQEFASMAGKESPASAPFCFNVHLTLCGRYEH